MTLELTNSSQREKRPNGINKKRERGQLLDKEEKNRREAKEGKGKEG